MKEGRKEGREGRRKEGRKKLQTGNYMLHLKYFGEHKNLTNQGKQGTVGDG
ncbi:hypothetical protein DPMN_045236 [Dreissena polymorpha]|uniref:Uncharacterized protein n=1 Tax=Dreissena polymorpha TaxID=45954 RepID=A0A9D4D3Z3_DREPO|nr:hypothetical protein DPMN_045236 [Dreissena polymorpha]